MEVILNEISKIDTHVHLGNVCGIKIPYNVQPQKNNENLLTLTDYNPYLSRLILSPLFPKSYLKHVIACAQLKTVEQLIGSMCENKIDQCWLLPIEPFVTSRDLFSWTNSNLSGKFIILAGVDFVTYNTEKQIFNTLQIQKQLFQCPGIKFHPNIQNIIPFGNVARFLYQAAEDLDMFILIHGGYTPFLPKGQNCQAKVRNFYKIFKEFPNLNVIFAHMGQYFDDDMEIIKELSYYPNFFVETSGVGSNTIRYALKHFDSDRILFGTDWPFCSHRLGIEILTRAIKKHTNFFIQQKKLFQKIVSQNPLTLTLPER